jgi:hypothetical protein
MNRNCPRVKTGGFSARLMHGQVDETMLYLLSYRPDFDAIEQAFAKFN